MFICGITFKIFTVTFNNLKLQTNPKYLGNLFLHYQHLLNSKCTDSSTSCLQTQKPHANQILGEMAEQEFIGNFPLTKV